MEEYFIGLLKEYGYVILFFWSMLEGELGLIMAGIMSHTGDMHVLGAIAAASVGGFIGDQIYFYIGRYNKGYITRKLSSQRRKFALAHIMLKKYGWPIIFLQRYLYGMRTIIPMSIGLTRYSAKMFALINFISAIAWASLTIVLAYIFGEELLVVVHWAKEHFYLALPLAAAFIGGVYYYMHKATNRYTKEVK